MTEKHNPLPWQSVEQLTMNTHLKAIFWEDDEAFGNIANNVTPENAAFIVKACNMHTELVEALRDIKCMAQKTDCMDALSICQDIEAEIDSILLKATKEG